jgi:hypothetical protein
MDESQQPTVRRLLISKRRFDNVVMRLSQPANPREDTTQMERGKSSDPPTSGTRP